MASNPRFQWLGELDKGDARQLMADSLVMVISSVMEGGANVVSEACRAGLPVIASDIPGNVGLLGNDYAGYFPVGKERALADLLYKVEQDPEFSGHPQASSQSACRAFHAGERAGGARAGATPGGATLLREALIPQGYGLDRSGLVLGGNSPDNGGVGIAQGFQFPYTLLCLVRRNACQQTTRRLRVKNQGISGMIYPFFLIPDTPAQADVLLVAGN